MGSSLRMLQGIDKDRLLRKQMPPINRSHLLSKMGHKVSAARLEGPDNVQKDLEQALKEPESRIEGV